MNSEMLSWSFSQNIPSATRKFVLLALADSAGHDGTVWIKIETLCSKTSLNRKTVIAAIKDLVNDGYLRDSGERRGGTRSIKVYRFVTEEWDKDRIPIPDLPVGAQTALGGI